jgi:hypothetical protein
MRRVCTNARSNTQSRPGTKTRQRLREQTDTTLGTPKVTHGRSGMQIRLTQMFEEIKALSATACFYTIAKARAPSKETMHATDQLYRISPLLLDVVLDGGGVLLVLLGAGEPVNPLPVPKTPVGQLAVGKTVLGESVLVVNTAVVVHVVVTAWLTMTALQIVTADVPFPTVWPQTFAPLTLTTLTSD